MKMKQNDFGTGIFSKNCQIYWGNKNGNLAAFQKRFPGIEFVKLHQTHSDEIILVKEIVPKINEFKGDGIITQRNKIAICVTTGDCLPIMFYNYKNASIGAVHAGWRGVANKITRKSIQQSLDLPSLRSEAVITNEKKFIKIWIGPHIGFDSFEVEQNIAEEIFEGVQGIVEGIHFKKSTKTGRLFVNLKEVLISQLSEFDMLDFSYISNQDTKTDETQCSHRRSPDEKTRQASWIIKNIN